MVICKFENQSPGKGGVAEYYYDNYCRVPIDTQPNSIVLETFYATSLEAHQFNAFIRAIIPDRVVLDVLIEARQDIERITESKKDF